MGKRRHVPFNQNFVKTNDLVYRNGVLVDQVFRRFRDAFAQAGVVKDYLNELEVYFTDPTDPTTGKVKTGAAWLYGERLALAAEASFSAAGVDVQPYTLYLLYAEAQDPDPNSSRGGTVVWYCDSYSIVCQPSESSPPAASLVRATLAWVGGQVVVTHNDQWLTLGVPLATGSVPTAALANEAVTRAKIAVGAVGGDRLQDGGVSYDALSEGVCGGEKMMALGTEEIKLAAGTDVAVLYGSAAAQATGSLDPETSLGEELVCATGEVETKVAGYFERVAAEGPVRFLKARVLYTVPAGAALTLRLRAWGPSGAQDYKEAVANLTPGAGECVLSLDVRDWSSNYLGRYVWAVIGEATVHDCTLTDALVVQAR